MTVLLVFVLKELLEVDGEFVLENPREQVRSERPVNPLFSSVGLFGPRHYGGVVGCRGI